ncbi:histidine phosphotransferase family protein [Rhodospirillum sp. A1_3_36]|uniref:histidine phosphotransferase family protein n=1 Tax=Rhodospirillum sp. A1_3_36 TaxID=3391666 RepID=UPI0039A6FE4C
MSPSSHLPQSSDFDLDLALLLCTRLCHDLAGPVGAVNTGAELLEEENGVADPETLELLAGSARSAANRLKLSRMAMGVARGRSPSLGDALAALSAGLDGMGKVLDAKLSGVADPGAEANRILINLTMVVAEAWPRANRIVMEASGDAFLITAEGGGELGEIWRAALAGEAGNLDPRTAQAYLAARLIRSLGGIVDLPPGRQGTLRFTPPPLPGV